MKPHRRFAAPVLAVFLALASLLPAHAADDPALSAVANQAFVAANARKPGVITRPNGLQYRVLQNGPGKRPGLGDTVLVNFSARLINGKLFDGTTPGLPATLSVSGVVRGLSEALQMMHVGDHWQLVIPTELGFGPRGAGNGIVPPNQALVFDVTLLSTSPAPPSGTDQGTTLSVYSANNAPSAILTIHP